MAHLCSRETIQQRTIVIEKECVTLCDREGVGGIIPLPPQKNPRPAVTFPITKVHFAFACPLMDLLVLLTE